MVDIPNKIEIDVESKSTNNLDTSLDTTDNIEQHGVQDNNISALDNVDVTNVVQEEPNAQETNSSEVVNCLALTVKKDYSLSIVKNVVVRTLKNVWRIAVSIFTLNLLKFFM